MAFTEKRNGSQSSLCDAGRIDANDPSVYEQIVQPWQLFCSPVERGSFFYDICYLKTPAITLYREHFGLQSRLRGLSPSNSFVFSIPLQLGSRTAFWKSPLQASGFPAMLPGGLDVMVDSQQVQLVILLNPALLVEHLSEEQVTKLRLAAKCHFLPANQEDVIRLGRWMLGLLRYAHLHPEMLQQENAVKSIEQDMLHLLAHAVQIPLMKNSTLCPSKRRKGLDHALNHLRQAEAADITISELVKKSGVSLRTLEYSFRDHFDLSPLEFLRRQRLHSARQKLVKANYGSTTVADIAHETGFYHLGRFSAYYKCIFGQPPLVTLKSKYTNPPDSPLQNYFA